MRPIIFLIALPILALAVVASLTMLSSSERVSPIDDGALPALPYSRQVMPIEFPASYADEALLKQVTALLTRLDGLDASVRDLRRDIALREGAVARAPAPTQLTVAEKGLQEPDLDAISERVRKELVDEAWRVRQEQCASTGRWLVREVPLRVETQNALIETICRFEKAWFLIERRLAAEDHSAVMARLVFEDERRVRVRLRKELKAIYGGSELVARLFLHIASHGELRSLAMSKEELFEIENLWI